MTKAKKRRVGTKPQRPKKHYNLLNLIKKYNTMRKKYIESTSFYDVLENITMTPLGVNTTPYYYKRKFDFIDVLVTFLQDEFDDDPFDPTSKKRQILAFFYFKPKDVRRSLSTRLIRQISLELEDFTSLVFEPQVRTLEHLLSSLSLKYSDINTALEIACQNDTQS